MTFIETAEKIVFRNKNGIFTLQKLPTKKLMEQKTKTIELEIK